MRSLGRAKGLLFDLDGTLFDTAPDLIDSLNAVLAEQSMPPCPAHDLANAVGHGSAPMIARAFNLNVGHPRFEPLRERFVEVYSERICIRTKAFAGIEALLAVLDRAALPWGIVTNKPGWLTRPLIAELGYSERPVCVVTGDDIALRKPHPHQVIEGCRRLQMAPSDCVVIGDAERDIQAGRSAGTLTLAALWGYLCGDDQASRWGADGLVEQPHDILHWVAR